jgi:hypothetical protein
MLWFSSELAQKTRAEREAKQALHEAGVAKKKEIIARSVVIKVDREVKRKFRDILFIDMFSLRHVSMNLKRIYKKLKMN